jgi:hypothetical protein
MRKELGILDAARGAARGAGRRQQGAEGDQDLLALVRRAGPAGWIDSPSDHNDPRVSGRGLNMTAAESNKLRKGNRVCWRGDAADSGTISETSWDAVTITWDNGHVATVHHGDMREIQSTSSETKRRVAGLATYAVQH